MAKRDITQNKAYIARQNANQSNTFDRFNPEAGGTVGNNGDYLGNYGTPFIGYDGPVGSNGQPTITQQQYGNFFNTGKIVSPLIPQRAPSTITPYGASPNNAALFAPGNYVQRPTMRTRGGSYNPNNPFKDIINQPETFENLAPKNPFENIENQNKQIDTTSPSQANSSLINKFGKNTTGWSQDQFDQRNTQLAQIFSDNGITDAAGIANALRQDSGFAGATAADQQNTINQIMSRTNFISQRNDPADNVAREMGYNNFKDFQDKAGAPVANQVQSLLNDIMKYEQTGDYEAKNYALQTLNSLMAQGKNLDVTEQTRNTETLVELSKMNPQAAGVVEQFNLVQNLMGQGVKYQDLPKYIGKDQNYIDSLLSGDWSKLGVELSQEQQNEIFEKTRLDKEKLENDFAREQEKLNLQIQRNVEDYAKHTERQRRENQIQADNLSVLSRLTGIGYSSSGMDGIEHTRIQGQQVLQDLRTAFERADYDLKQGLSAVADTYVYNTKAYDIAYRDSMKKFTAAFSNDIVQIQGRFGKSTQESMNKIVESGNSYLKNLADLNKFRAEQQRALSNDAWSQYKEGEQLKLERAKLGLTQQDMSNKWNQQQYENNQKNPQPTNTKPQQVTLSNGKTITMNPQAAQALDGAIQNIGIKVDYNNLYRTLADQQKLYGKGRTSEELQAMGIPGEYAKPNENIVTWTPNASSHMSGNAVDVVLPKGADKVKYYEGIDASMAQLGFTRPKETVAKGDYGHYEYTGATLGAEFGSSTVATSDEYRNKVLSTYDATTQAYIEQILDGQIKIQNVPTDVRNNVTQGVAVLSRKENRPLANDTIRLYEALMNIKRGLEDASLPQSTSVYLNPDLMADYNYIKSNLSLESVVAARAKGVTFGAMSNAERTKMAAAATSLAYYSSKTKNIKEIDNILRTVVENTPRLQDYIDEQGSGEISGTTGTTPPKKAPKTASGGSNLIKR